MECIRLTVLLLLFVISCQSPGGQLQERNSQPEDSSQHRKSASLAESRHGFETKLIRQEAAKKPVPEPPALLFRVIRYASSVGQLVAYLSQPPQDGKKHPAIIWIFGGFGNSIGETAWEEAPPENDQSASAFRRAGIIMMYPSLRGGNENPGFKEGFFGEVDDVLAAAEYLARQDYVDSQRIYLGGHSTGGTLVLLVAEATNRFRAVFSFGPVDDVGRYGAKNLPFDTSDKQELELRAPVRWLQSVQSPLYIFEGNKRIANLDSLQALAHSSHNPAVHFFVVNGADHFSILAPMTSLLAGKILRDDGPGSNITITEKELNSIFTK